MAESRLYHKLQLDYACLLALAAEILQELVHFDGRQKQGFFMDGHVGDLCTKLESRLDKFRQFLEDHSDEIAHSQRLETLYRYGTPFMPGMDPDFVKYANTAGELETQIRRKVAELLFQAGMRMLQGRSSAQAADLLEKAVKVFPEKEAVVILSRLYAGAGNDIKARQVMQILE